MAATNNTNSTPTRDQMVDLFKELQEIIYKFSTLLIALIAALNTDIGKSLFEEHPTQMNSLGLILVLYFFLVIFGTILQNYKKSLLPIINFATLLLLCAASFLALSIISPTVAWITLALWVGLFILVVYDYAVPERIKNWIKARIARVAELLPI